MPRSKTGAETSKTTSKTTSNVLSKTGAVPSKTMSKTRGEYTPHTPQVLPPPGSGLSTLLGIQEEAYGNGGWLIPYSGPGQTDAERQHLQKRSPSSTHALTRSAEPPLAALQSHPRPTFNTLRPWVLRSVGRTWARGRSSSPSGVRAHLTPSDPQKELSHVHDH